MDRNELETYQVQLSQVELALVSDPDNAELTSLRSELKELISLTEQALAQSEAAASLSTAASSSKSKSTSGAATTPTFAAGDEILAKYSGDGKWYPARITSIGGADDRRVYSVVFKGYNSTELVAAGDVKALPANYAATSASSASAGTKRKAVTKEEEEEAARKKKKNEKRTEVRAQKSAEQQQKQVAWQKFAKKGEKKGVVIAGMQGKSIFASPDNPYGRVGVTGSGKGMSDTVTRIKHKFAPTE
ncbi:hypothetical protein M407DRAFT_242972 [Tulasnella calospora MUT 4182]|uniref:Tudor domain-containing protein n=1 Tax=Tulasnella calospora MUT 4182 TaxID=1051891 RepID=A0A0C3M4D4_9AGAM|nr:hypothetical protein M407DRAFT_242972 [Tulasnella calospora MUT 4182]